MAFSLNEFKAQLTGGGASPTQFMVKINNPIVPAADFKSSFMIKTASLPSSSIGSIIVPFMGRQAKYGGDRVFEDWTVTVVNDEDFVVRNALEAWSNSINTHLSNQRGLPSEYKSDGQVTQYAKDGSILRVYRFQGLFPINIAEIPVGWDMTDAIEEYQVTFQYDEWDIDGGTTGNSVS